ncbi:MAG: DUF2339 domain-containing protein [Methylococcales bacterium]|nr:DUF2339 domain-containing protein [Methylococcales bacterium]
MPWVVALLAGVIAATSNEHIGLWALVGFMAGYLLDLRSKIAELEVKLDYLRNTVLELNTSQPVPPPTAVQAAPPPDDQAEQPAPLVFNDLATEQPPPVFQVEAEATETYWLSEPVPLHAAKSPEPEFKPQPQAQSTWDYTDREDSGPSDFDKLIQFIWGWFTDGNTFVRVGIVILFVGVSFLLNLAIDHGYISLQLRLSALAAGAIGLLVLGWRLRETRGAYALLIQGGAVGLLYLIIFASYNLYHLLPSGLAFGLLVLIVSVAAALAVLENAVSLALFGSIGGFLAPVLTSSGTNNYIGLFSFYALLNAGIFALAWFKAWRVLNLVGFGFTFSIGAFWGASSYRPENFATVLPFLVLFFLFYVAIAMLYASRRAPNFKDYIDGTLIFGTPILAFGLLSAMVKGYEYGVAISALVLGLFYLGLAAWVWKRLGDALSLLAEALLSIGVIFLTLAIPFAWDGATTSATWAVESTGVLWVSIRQQQVVRRIFAYGLQFCAGVALVVDSHLTGSVAFLNSAFIGVVIISVCAGLSSWLLVKDFFGRRDVEKILSPFFLAYGLLWLYAGFNQQIQSYGLHDSQNDLLLSLTVFLTVLLTVLGRRLLWTAAAYAALSMMLPMLLVAFLLLITHSHPSAGLGLWLWPLAFTGYFYSLKAAEFLDEDKHLNLHLFSGLFLCTLLFWEGFWQLLLAGSLLSLLFNSFARRWSWPQMRVLALGLFPVMVWLAVATVFTDAGHPFYLPDRRMGVVWPFDAGVLLWPLAFLVLHGLFFDGDIQKGGMLQVPSFRGLSLILLVILLTWEASWHVTAYLPWDNGWNIALLPLFAVGALTLIMWPRFWPFSAYQEDYLVWASPWLNVGLMAWSLVALASAADASPLPWLPLLNPAELMQAVVLVTLYRFTAFLPEDYLDADQKPSHNLLLACFTFVWLNFMLFRALHHWGGLDWSLTLFSKPLTQTSLSIFWTLIGLSLTVVATRLQERYLWITGAGLLTVVVLKLFLFDLHSHNSMERIVSFITVGILLMMIGYFAPLPPKREE